MKTLRILKGRPKKRARSPARALYLLPLWACLSSCGYMDFGGDPEKSWDFVPFWAGATSLGPEDPKNPGYDADGNRIPPPEVAAVYALPDIHAGFDVSCSPKARITPVVGVELAEVRVPYLRWFNAQVQVGNQLADFYVGKRFTSIIEITAGLWWGRDFEEDAWSWGIGGTLIRF